MGLLKEIKPFCSKQSTQILFSVSISNHSLLPSLLSHNSTSIRFSCENNHSKNFAFINLHRFPSDYWCCLTRVSRIIGPARCRLNSSQIQDIYDEADWCNQRRSLAVAQISNSDLLNSKEELCFNYIHDLLNKKIGAINGWNHIERNHFWCTENWR